MVVLEQSTRSVRAGAATRLDVQGLRAVAVLLVIAFHAGLPVPAGFAGVDVFFVISGFVITGQIQRLQEAGRWSFREFYARRVRRLTPALVVMVLAVLLGSLLFQSPLGLQDTTSKTAVGALLAAGNLAIFYVTGGYFDSVAAGNPLLHTWSLGVEEQFYLVFPVLLLFLRRRWLVALTALTFAGSAWLTYSDRLVAGHPLSQFAFYSSPTRAWEFGAGSLLALWLGSRRVDLDRPVRWAPASGGVLLLVVMNLVVSGDTAWPGVLAVLPVAATVLLIAAGSLGDNPVSRLLATRPFVAVGDLSYSLYLWHWPAIVFATLLWPNRPWVPALAAAASFLPAWASYRWVEQPIRAHRGSRVFTVALMTLAAGVVLSLAMPRAGLALVPGARDLAVDRHTLTYGRSNGCMVDGRRYEHTDIARCTVRVPNARGWVLLAGDSHAEALSTGFISAAGQLGYDAVALTGTGCAVVAGATSETVPNCSELSQDVLDLATSPAGPAVVVLAHWSTPRMSHAAAWRSSYGDTLARLRARGMPTVVALDVPNFASWHTVDGTPCPGGLLTFHCAKPEEEVLAYGGAARTMERQLAAEQGAVVLDPWPAFCHGGTCDPRMGGRLAYWDYDHLNGIGSVALTPVLVGALREAAGCATCGRSR